MEQFENELNLAPAPIVTNSESSSSTSAIMETSSSITSYLSPEAAADFKYVREQMLILVKEGMLTMKAANNLAESTESPSAIESASNHTKVVSEVMEKVIKLHQTKQQLEDMSRPLEEVLAPSEQQTVQQQQNNFFVGSTAELQKLLKEKMGSVNDVVDVVGVEIVPEHK